VELEEEPVAIPLASLLSTECLAAATQSLEAKSSIGYQNGTTYGFFGGYGSARNNINEAYLDGVSLTHGNSTHRRHLLLFATGYNQFNQESRLYNSPQYSYDSPWSVDRNFFSESGATTGQIFLVARLFVLSLPIFCWCNSAFFFLHFFPLSQQLFVPLFQQLFVPSLQSSSLPALVLLQLFFSDLLL